MDPDTPYITVNGRPVHASEHAAIYADIMRMLQSPYTKVLLAPSSSAAPALAPAVNDPRIPGVHHADLPAIMARYSRMLSGSASSRAAVVWTYDLDTGVSQWALVFPDGSMEFEDGSWAPPGVFSPMADEEMRRVWELQEEGGRPVAHDGGWRSFGSMGEVDEWTMGGHDRPMGMMGSGAAPRGHLVSGIFPSQPPSSRTSGGRRMPGASALGPSIRGFTERNPRPSLENQFSRQASRGMLGASALGPSIRGFTERPSSPAPKRSTKEKATSQKSPASDYVYGGPRQSKPVHKPQPSEKQNTKTVTFSGSTKGISTATTPSKSAQSKVRTLSDLPKTNPRYHRCSVPSDTTTNTSQVQTQKSSSHPFRTQGQTLGTSSNPSDRGNNPRTLGSRSRAQGTTPRPGNTTTRRGSGGRTVERAGLVTYSGMPTNIRKRPDYKGAGSREDGA